LPLQARRTAIPQKAERPRACSRANRTTYSTAFYARHRAGRRRDVGAAGRAPSLALRSTVARWARAARFVHLTGRSCLSAAAKPRSEFCDPTSSRASQGSPDGVKKEKLGFRRDTHTPRAPRCHDKAINHRTANEKRPRGPRAPQALINQQIRMRGTSPPAAHPETSQKKPPSASAVPWHRRHRPKPSGTSTAHTHCCAWTAGNAAPC
jgi:superfamily II DNA/RNA helicase